MNVSYYLDPISEQYNPENDMIPRGPRVTWAEYNLMMVVRAQQVQIDELKRRIDKINAMLPSTAEAQR